MTRLIRTLLITPLVSTLTGRLPFLLKLVLFTFNLSFRLDTRSFYLTHMTPLFIRYTYMAWRLFQIPLRICLVPTSLSQGNYTQTTVGGLWCFAFPRCLALRLSTHSLNLYLNRFARHLVGRWTGECSCYYATVLSLSNMSRTEGLRASSLAVFPQQSLMPLSTLCTRNRMSTQTS